MDGFGKSLKIYKPIYFCHCFKFFFSCMLIYTPEQHRANGHTTTRDKMDNIDDLNNDITDLGSSNI